MRDAAQHILGKAESKADHIPSVRRLLEFPPWRTIKGDSMETMRVNMSALNPLYTRMLKVPCNPLTETRRHGFQFSYVPLSWKQQTALARTEVAGTGIPTATQQPDCWCVITFHEKAGTSRAVFVCAWVASEQGRLCPPSFPSALWVSDPVAGWLNSARMAEISHLCAYNFSPWCEFN